MQNDELYSRAKQTITANDYGKYTVPSQNLYPFQWNWDSCLTAVGIADFDEPRAWLEIETLFQEQWPDGMVPHIIFHRQDPNYFPGPEVWQTNTPTSGITQPAVAGFVLALLYTRAKDKALARQKVELLLPKIADWHNWFYKYRDLNNEGLVAILHPWESGRDNSIDWDSSLELVPIEKTVKLERRDTKLVDSKHRPTEQQYKAYISLVQIFRELNWDNSKLLDASPFQLLDPGFNAILLYSCLAIAELAAVFDETKIAQQSNYYYKRGVDALERLYSHEYKQYLCYDLRQDKAIESPSIGGLLPILVSDKNQIIPTLKTLAGKCRYLIPSHDPTDDRFDQLRYWRGPAWLITNFLIRLGLNRVGEEELADKITNDSLALIQKSGFSEYYCPLTGSACGGNNFTWTAAMVIEFLKQKSW